MISRVVDSGGVVTELQNNVNRWYNPELGKWLSEDPIGFNAGDTNVYRYVGNNTIQFSDPSGLCKPGDVVIDVVSSKVTNIAIYPLGIDGTRIRTKPLAIYDIDAYELLGQSVASEMLTSILLQKIPMPSTTGITIALNQVISNVELVVTYRVVYFETRCVPKRTWTGFCSWNTEYVWETDRTTKFKTVTAGYIPASGKIGRGVHQDSTILLNEELLPSFIEAIIREQLGSAFDATSGQLQDLIQKEVTEKPWWQWR